MTMDRTGLCNRELIYDSSGLEIYKVVPFLYTAMNRELIYDTSGLWRYSVFLYSTRMISLLMVPIIWQVE
jgi:hypothetical protein